MKTPKKHLTHWTVLFSTGYREYYRTEEAARIVCLMYGGIGLTAPIYRDID